MDTNKSLKNYLDEISSNSPTPGGGNVSAFAGSLACSLGIMVCNLTIGKKKYLEVEEEIKDIKFQLENFKEKFLQLAEEDNAAFDKVMEAFKLPKETDSQKEERKKKIEDATFHAASIPSQVIKICSNVMPLIQSTAQKGNQNSLSDAGVAATLLSTAAQGAYLNVLINCSSLPQNNQAVSLLKRSEELLHEIQEESDDILAIISTKLKA
jgi:formiminotetrahydrofolate cyclodeaminase